MTLRRTLLAGFLGAAVVAIAGLAVGALSLGYQAQAMTFGLLAAWFAIAGATVPRRARRAVLVALCALFLGTALHAWVYESPAPPGLRDFVWSTARMTTTEQLQARVVADLPSRLVDLVPMLVAYGCLAVAAAALPRRARPRLVVGYTSVAILVIVMVGWTSLGSSATVLPTGWDRGWLFASISAALLGLVLLTIGLIGLGFAIRWSAGQAAVAGIGLALLVWSAAATAWPPTIPALPAPGARMGSGESLATAYLVSVAGMPDVGAAAAMTFGVILFAIACTLSAPPVRGLTDRAL